MSSGKYSAISGAVGRMENMNRISHQLSAVKTPGFKKGVSTFSARLGEINSGMATEGTNYTRITAPEIDFSAGPMEYSGDTLDVAINGEGFFRILKDDGEFAYARKGNFQLNGDGLLIDSSGHAVLGVGNSEITLPHPDVEILPDGTIWADGAQLGQLELYDFPDKSILDPVNGDMFVPRDGSEPEVVENPVLVQKNLEGANIDMMKTMANMTSNLRAFEATQKALKIYSDMDSKAADIGQIQ